MQSKFRFEYDANGNLLSLVSSGDKLYAEQVGTAEYYLSMKSKDALDNWLPSDKVFISFTKPNGENVVQLMFLDGDSWKHTSNGWETNLSVIEQSSVRVNFICRRYTSDKKLVSTKTTEQVELSVFPSAGYSSMDEVAGSQVEVLLDMVQRLDKVVADYEDTVIVADKITASAEILPAGSSATVDITHTAGEDTNFKFGVPKADNVKNITSGTPVVEGEYTVTPVVVEKDSGQISTFAVSAKQGIDGVDGIGIATITSGTAIVETDKTITPVTVAKTDGSKDQFNVTTQNGTNGKNGDGVFAVNVEDGDLILYTQNVQGAGFEIREDGYLAVNFNN